MLQSFIQFLQVYLEPLLLNKCKKKKNSDVRLQQQRAVNSFIFNLFINLNLNRR